MNPDALLERNDFRESVFKRDGHKCVLCFEPAQDAHHIIERRLWGDGGYYLNNGASLCGKCHIKAESTDISCEEIRSAAKIERVALPEHLYRDNEYDKWGNIILPNGSRIKGELFFDESVQKILGDKIKDFSSYVKYPRTYHLPFSESRTKDDRTLSDCSIFEGREVVVTEKMDGENSSLYHDGYFHARSLEFEPHDSRTWVKNKLSQIAWELPEGWRLCGENVFAKHAIYYDSLKSYYYLFSIWNDKNRCLSWNETTEFAEILGLETVPVLYKGQWKESKIKEIAKSLNKEKQEGFVVRLSDGFNYSEFRKSAAKYVRKDHVADTVHNWKFQKVVPNKLIGGC